MIRPEISGMVDLRASRPRHWGRSAPRAVAFWAIPILLGLFAGNAQAAGPIFSAVLGGSGQDYATSVTSDAQGDVYVAGLTYSSDFPVTAGAVQTKFGGTCDAFVAKVGPDGQVIWATYLGGILDDWATGVALDSTGNVLVTGWTRSANFPIVNPLMTTLDNGASPDAYDAFVAKIDPSGAKLLYSTFLGGAADDGAAGIAVDAAGNAYVAVNTSSTTGFPGIPNASGESGIVVSKLAPQGTLIYSFFHPNGSAGGIALDSADSAYVAGSSAANPSTATQTFGPPGSGYAIVFKISPDGSKKIYETALGGSVQAAGAAIAVDSAGEAYVAGSTSSADFPLVHPFQSSLGARPLWKSTNGGSSWTPMDDLPFALPQMLVVDPDTANTIYEATGDLGVFKSLDGGVTWSPASSGIASMNIQALAIDPVDTQILYAATASNAVYKTVNGGNSWTLIDSPTLTISQLAVDAKNPKIIWEIGNGLRKSTDGGVTWNSVTFPGPLQSMVLDPRVSGDLFAASNFVFCGLGCTNNPYPIPYLYRSVDGGANWIQVPTTVQPALPLIVDGSTNPSTVYDGLSFRSVDEGVTWSPINPPPGANSNVSALAVDAGGTLYAAFAGQGMYLSRDHAQTWTAISSVIPAVSFEALGPGVSNLVPAGSSGTLYATTDQVATSGFVTKLSADGSSIVYSTYLRGHASLESSVFYAAEPNVFLTPNQNWISAHRAGRGGQCDRGRRYACHRFPGGDARASCQRRTGGRLRGNALGGWQHAELLHVFRRLPRRWRAGRDGRFPGRSDFRGPNLVEQFPQCGRVAAALLVWQCVCGETSGAGTAGNYFRAERRQLPAGYRSRILGDDSGLQSREHVPWPHMDRKRNSQRRVAQVARWRQRHDGWQAGLRVLHQPHADQRAGAFG